MEDTTSAHQQQQKDGNEPTSDIAVQHLTSTTAAETTHPTSDERALMTTTSMQEVITASSMEEVTIAELKPTSYDKILEARVYRKWIAVNYQKNGRKTEIGFCCILIDREVRHSSSVINKPF